MLALGNTTAGTLAFLDVGGEHMNMELPTESPTALGENRLLQDLRQLPDNEVTLVLGTVVVVRAI